MPLRFIIFSKNRTLQTYSCLYSLIKESGLSPQNITILYVDSPQIPYEPLKNKFKKCTFVRQSDFYTDINNIVRESPEGLIGFLVDDSIVRREFSPPAITELFAQNPGLDAFSLRLGKHIADGTAPVFRDENNDIYSYKTAPHLGKSWNYFWELSGSVYRRNDVLKYLNICSKKEITFPNPLESVYYKKIPNFISGIEGGITGIPGKVRAGLWSRFRPQERIKKIAFFEKSCIVIQGVNLVANLNEKRKEYFSPEELHTRFLQGCRIDYSNLKNFPNKKPNIGPSHFALVDAEGKPFLDSPLMRSS